MNSEVNLFPRNALEALALAYVQKTAASSATPEDYVRLYWEAYYRIWAASREAAREAHAKFSRQ